MSELETQNAEEKKMSSECLEMSKAERLIVEFFNNADSVQVEEGAWYYSESSVEAELLEVYAKLAKAKEDYKTLFSAFESCQDELKESNERESVLSCQLDSHIERVAELEKENKRESMELRSRLGSALGRNSEMVEQLAKANERVAELEFQHQLLTKRIEPLLDMQEDGEYYTRCDLADDIYEAFIEGSSVDALNKFATEKKIEGVNDFCATIQGYEDVQPIGANYVTSVAAHRDSFIEQLRNEQE